MHVQPTLLVIDDEPENFDVIESLLYKEGYKLHYLSSGAKAVEHLEAFQPDVILLDVMMPDLNGLDVCRRLKAHPQWKHIPVIMVTALNAKEDLAQCLSQGANDFIGKPINGMELRARVRSMLQIKQQYDDLQALLQLREDMVGMILHDLRNPLAAILLAAHMLRLPDLPPTKQQQKVDQIEIAGQQLQSLIDSLLIMAKLESGKMVLNCTQTDLYELCVAVVKDFEAIAAQRQQSLITQLPEPGHYVAIDAAVFRRVIDNLLMNAIKFSPKGSQIILQAAYLQPDGLKIQVTDSGPGVSEALKQQIFEKYEVGTPIKDVSQIGLGLAFCKLAIEAHGGSITITDNHPNGATFTVAFPTAPH